jgi:GT2 family glycosyltransferase
MLSAIIVTYGTPAELSAAVASLRAQDRPPDEIIVVDTGACEGHLGHEDSLDVTRIECPATNLGYGAGCNLGAQVASGDQLLMMNADVVLNAHATALLTATLDRDERIAVVGPRILSGGEVQLSARAFPTLRTGFLGRRSLLTRLLIRARRFPSELRPAHTEGGRVDWVSGACMIVRRSAFDAVGGFDERYWMYWEDADLCRRLFDANWEVQFEPRAIVHHATGASGTSRRTISAFHDSATRFALRHIAHTQPESVAIKYLLRLRRRLVLQRFDRSPRMTQVGDNAREPSALGR